MSRSRINRRSRALTASGLEGRTRLSSHSGRTGRPVRSTDCLFETTTIEHTADVVERPRPVEIPLPAAGLHERVRTDVDATEPRSAFDSERDTEWDKMSRRGCLDSHAHVQSLAKDLEVRGLKLDQLCMDRPRCELLVASPLLGLSLFEFRHVRGNADDETGESGGFANSA